MGKVKVWRTFGAVLVLVLAACGPAGTPAPIATTVSTATPAAAATPVAAVTPQPLATPTPPKPTPTAGPTRGGILKPTRSNEPSSWHPIFRQTPSLYVKGSVFSRLFTLWPAQPRQCDSELTPWLVKEWRWTNDRTAEFTIHQGVKFQNKPPVNGREVTADDVVFSMGEYLREPLIAAKLKLLEWEVVSKYTFRIKSNFTWGGMVLEAFGNDYGPMVFAKEGGGPKGELWEIPDKSWIGSGGFSFERWVPGVKWVLARNPDYWKPNLPLLDSIEVQVIPDKSTQMAAMRAGKINIAHLWGDLQVEDVQKSKPGVQVLRCPSASNTPGTLAMNNEGPPFNDARVRRAVSMAIDRQAIVDVPHNGKATIVAVLRPGIPYAMAVQDFPPELRQYLEYHPDRSKALLAEAGYPNGFDTVLNVRIVGNQNDKAVYEALTDMLVRAGIRAKMNVMEFGRYAATVSNAEYPVGQMAVGALGQRTPEEGHALAFPSFRYAGVINRSRANDPEYERMFEEFISTTDEPRRVELARQLQLRQIDQAYRMVLPIPFDLMVLGPEVRVVGFRSTEEPSPMFERAWIAR